MNVANVMSSKRDDWETPQYILDYLSSNNYHFTLDPCSTDSNYKFPKHYTVATNGLSIPWINEVVFVNPPYSDSSSWIKKCYDEHAINHATCVLLIANRTENKAWFQYVQRAQLIQFITPRVKFELNGNPVGSPTFGSTLVYFDNSITQKRVEWVELRRR